MAADFPRCASAIENATNGSRHDLEAAELEAGGRRVADDHGGSRRASPRQFAEPEHSGGRRSPSQSRRSGPRVRSRTEADGRHDVRLSRQGDSLLNSRTALSMPGYTFDSRQTPEGPQFVVRSPEEL